MRGNLGYFDETALLLPGQGENSISMGNSSRRPASMSKIRASLERRLRLPKFPAGPTRPRPGPMLFKHAATAVKAEVKSRTGSVSYTHLTLPTILLV